MIILSSNEINEKYNLENKVMSKIEKEDIGGEISLITFEIVMLDQTPKTISDAEQKIIINLHPTDGTHWVGFSYKMGESGKLLCK